MDPKTPDNALGETLVAPLQPVDRESLGSLDVKGPRYDLRALLGRGGMGEVHLCADKLIGREIALKQILPQARGGDGLARFVREAKVQARLEHPSIVPVYDIGTNPDGTVWFTMKRIRGRSLEEFSAEHGEKAIRAIGATSDASAAQREGALQELGRAMALDPENGLARDFLMRLLITPPKEVPPQARAKSWRSSTRRTDGRQPRTERSVTRCGARSRRSSSGWAFAT